MKTVNSIAYRSPQFAVLSERELSDLHQAALEVLRRTGIDFHHQGALDLLKEAGAFVDGNRVKFPPVMVADALASAPNRVVMCNRFGEPCPVPHRRRRVVGHGRDPHRGGLPVPLRGSRH